MVEARLLAYEALRTRIVDVAVFFVESESTGTVDIGERHILFWLMGICYQVLAW